MTTTAPEATAPAPPDEYLDGDQIDHAEAVLVALRRATKPLPPSLVARRAGLSTEQTAAVLPWLVRHGYATATAPPYPKYAAKR